MARTEVNWAHQRNCFNGGPKVSYQCAQLLPHQEEKPFIVSHGGRVTLGDHLKVLDGVAGLPDGSHHCLRAQTEAGEPLLPDHTVAAPQGICKHQEAPRLQQAAAALKDHAVGREVSAC